MYLSPRTGVWIVIALTLGVAMFHLHGSPSKDPQSSPLPVVPPRSTGSPEDNPAVVGDVTPPPLLQQPPTKKKGHASLGYEVPSHHVSSTRRSTFTTVYQTEEGSRHHPMSRPPSVSTRLVGSARKQYEGDEAWWGDNKGPVFKQLLDTHGKMCENPAEGRGPPGGSAQRAHADGSVIFSSNPFQKIIGFGNSENHKLPGSIDPDDSPRTLSGQWNRFWIQGRGFNTTTLEKRKKETPTTGGYPSTDESSRANVQCRSGDIYQVLLESPASKVDVFQVYDLGNGLHEVHFFLRRPGVYSLCVDLTHTQAGYPEEMRSTLPFDNLGKGFVRRRKAAQTLPGKDEYRGALSRMCTDRVGPRNKNNPNKNVRFQYTSKEICMGTARSQATVLYGPTMTPPRDNDTHSIISCHLPRKSTSPKTPSLSRLAHPHMFRSGSWIKMHTGECDGVHCLGNLRDLSPGASLSPIKRSGQHPNLLPEDDPEDFLKDTFRQSWVWASDYCTLAILKPPAKYPLPTALSRGGSSTAAVNTGTTEEAADPPFAPNFKNSAVGNISPSLHLNLRGGAAGGGGVPRGTVDGQWILGWGDSTLKQPLANMVEYNLQLPLMEAGAGYGPVFMEEIPALQRKMKKDGKSVRSMGKALPGFFRYREWDFKAPALSIPSNMSLNVSQKGHRAPTTHHHDESNRAELLSPFRVTFTWGGCQAITAAPTACPSSIGMTNTKGISRYLSQVKRKNTGVSRGPSVSTNPALVLLEHFHWRFPLADEVSFVENMNSTFYNLLFPVFGPTAADVDLLSQSALVVWNGYPVHVHNEDMRAQCSWPPPLPTGRHFRLSIEDYWDRQFRSGPGNVVFVDRTAVTNPLHFGDRYGHFGVHYGSGHGMCHTGREQGYDRAECKRDTLADDALVMLWLNLLNAVKNDEEE